MHDLFDAPPTSPQPTICHRPPPRSSSICVSSAAVPHPYSSGLANRWRSSLRLPPRGRASDAARPRAARSSPKRPEPPPRPSRPLSARPSRPPSPRARSAHPVGCAASGTRPAAVACSKNSRLRLVTRCIPAGGAALAPRSWGDTGDTGGLDGGGDRSPPPAAAAPAAAAAAAAAPADGLRRWPSGFMSAGGVTGVPLRS